MRLDVCGQETRRGPRVLRCSDMIGHVSRYSIRHVRKHVYSFDMFFRQNFGHALRRMLRLGMLSTCFDMILMPFRWEMCLHTFSRPACLMLSVVVWALKKTLTTAFCRTGRRSICIP